MSLTNNEAIQVLERLLSWLHNVQQKFVESDDDEEVLVVEDVEEMEPEEN